MHTCYAKGGIEIQTPDHYIHSMKKREQQVSRDEFIRLLQSKKIRPASLDDVYGTHHRRKLYKHPNIGAWYVEVRSGQ